MFLFTINGRKTEKNTEKYVQYKNLTMP